MISVTIFINNKPLFTRSAVNVGVEKESGRQVYRVDEGTIIKQYDYKGAVKLAIKMLKTIKENE